MLTQEERLLIGMKVLEKLKPNLRGRHPRQQATGREAAPGKATTLEDLVEQAGVLSPYSVILGACDDGLPFLLDLTNPAPGSLLAVGDPACGKTRLLRSMLASTVRLNSAEEVSFYLICSDWREYIEVNQAPHCLGFMTPEDYELPAILETLVETVESRRSSPHPGGEQALILLIDDLASLLQSLDSEGFAHLYWLIRHGPRSRVWTIAGLTAQAAAETEPRLLAAFRTRLMGKTAERGLAAFLSGKTASQAHALQAGEQFCVPFGDSWVRFRICDSARQTAEPGDEQDLE